MNPAYYYILHVFSILVLTAHTYMALANPDPANRKRTMMVTGIAALLVLVSGMGLMAKLHPGQFPAWMFVKAACLVGLSAIAGMAYRKAHLRGVLSFAGLALMLVSLWAVYIGRF